MRQTNQDILELTTINMKNTDKPAYPTNARMHSDMTGLTKREYFAGLAMQALISRSPEDARYINNIGLPDIEMVTSESLAYADSLLLKLDIGKTE